LLVVDVVIAMDSHHPYPYLVKADAIGVIEHTVTHPMALLTLYKFACWLPSKHN
jgi:hypothetical protein